MILGAIADDLTGATDLALMLAREGMMVVQVVGVPPQDFDFGDAEAVVIALKSRTIPATEAVALSLDAANALHKRGARQILFKYCSTFDSTPKGNIGPVTEALMAQCGTQTTIACPAFPANGRTVFNGHLFVGQQLLSDSPMKDHPLTPMTNSNLVQVLQAQVAARVGLVAHNVVDQGAAAIAKALRGDPCIWIVDAIADAQLRQIGSAIAELPLITGGSGIAIGLPAAYTALGWRQSSSENIGFSAPKGPAVMLAGSCSVATRGQIADAIAKSIPTLKINPLDVAAGKVTPADAIAFVQNAAHIPLVYSSADPADVRAIQDKLGRDQAGELIEHFMAETARGLQSAGYRRFLVAGGETSGAVVAALGVSAMRIGPEIDPGVPWTVSLGTAPVAMALKSGNFGAPDFFTKAWKGLE